MLFHHDIPLSLKSLCLLRIEESTQTYSFEFTFYQVLLSHHHPISHKVGKCFVIMISHSLYKDSASPELKTVFKPTLSSSYRIKHYCCQHHPISPKERPKILSNTTTAATQKRFFAFPRLLLSIFSHESYSLTKCEQHI